MGFVLILGQEVGCPGSLSKFFFCIVTGFPALDGKYVTLASSFPEDVWAWWLLMHWLQLQFTPREALPSVWIGFAWQYSQACRHPCCLCTFSYPISSFRSTLHLICFDTALIEQPPLSVMTLCDYSLCGSGSYLRLQRKLGFPYNVKKFMVKYVLLC